MDGQACFGEIQEHLKQAITSKGIKLGSLTYLDKKLVIPSLSGDEEGEEEE